MVIKSGKFLFLAGLLAFGGFVLLFSVSKLSSCADIGCIVFPGKGDWKSIEVYEKTDKSWRGMITADSYKIRLYKVISNDQKNASEFTDISLMKIKGLLDDARSPYPGAISDTISCQDKYKLQQETINSDSGLEINYFRGFMNERLQYGACTDDQVSFVSEGGFVYCADSGEWYQIEIIYPYDKSDAENQFKDVYRKIACQRPSVKIGRLLP